MYFLVETKEQLSRLEHKDACFVQIIPDNYDYHPQLTGVSLIYYHNGDKGYIISVDHSESFSLSMMVVHDFISKHKVVHVFDKKFHSYYLDIEILSDINFQILESKGSIPNVDLRSKTQKDICSKYPNHPELNKIIPIVKHYEHMEALVEHYNKWIFPLSDTLHNDFRLSEAYGYVESSKIGIDESKFSAVYTLNNPFASKEGDGVYTKYNLYNTTGRPTNSFNGINFLAIVKDQRHRECIVPLGDRLVEFDFDAYHLRLLAHKIGYDFGQESIHEQLGKIYFKTDELTGDQYAKSKEKTFQMLYGGNPSGIEFFEKLREFENSLWSLYKKNRGLIFPTGMRFNYSETVTKNVLFNYYVQNLETSNNIDRIMKIKAFLEGKRTKLILITYDAFLFDFHQDDGKETLIEIKNILQDENETKTYVKYKYGVNYFLSKS
jgi:hypothetical protein